MDVCSAFNSGLSGFQSASAQLSNASSRVAHAGIADNSMANALSASENLSSVAEQAPISITTELINMKMAELQGKASAKVISTADDLVGSLIDISV